MTRQQRTRAAQARRPNCTRARIPRSDPARLRVVGSPPPTGLGVAPGRSTGDPTSRGACSHRGSPKAPHLSPQVVTKADKALTSEPLRRGSQLGLSELLASLAEGFTALARGEAHDLGPFWIPGRSAQLCRLFSGVLSLERDELLRAANRCDRSRGVRAEQGWGAAQQRPEGVCGFSPLSRLGRAPRSRRLFDRQRAPGLRQ